MRIPLSWLREYAPLPQGASAEYLLETLVRVGFEEEEVHRPAEDLRGPIVVGQVLSVEPETHSNGKTVNWCHVRVVPEGREQHLTGEGIDPSGVQGIVCGAHNFSVGDKVVVTLPGAELPGGFRITPRRTYGHTSAGMIASVRELGIGEDHEGILVLSRLGLDPEPGADVIELLGLHEEAAEINVTPDRGYALSLRGVAREFCHAVREDFQDPALPLQQRAPEDNGRGCPVSLQDDTPIHGTPGCTRFLARTVSGVDATRPTPPWMASRLRLAGIRPISLLVDISNYVMLELGQPLHFYDASTIRGPIRVRRAGQDEQLQTLDGKLRTLHPEDLVIADAEEVIGLAGVMGGERTEVTASTTRVLIEAAHFDEVSVARTRRRHKLSSEASRRFERGVDILVAPAAAQRAAELLVELAGGTLEEGVTDLHTRLDRHQIILPEDYTTARIGMEVSADQAQQILEEIGAEVVETGAVLQVTVPSWRPDLVDREDLTEEIARLIGYEHIPARLPVPPAGRGYTVEQAGRRRVSQALAAAGLVEVFSYPFVTEEENGLFGVAEPQPDLPAVKVINPISEANGWLQRSLLPGMLQVLKRNHSRGFKDLALFQTGLVFHPGAHQGSGQLPGLAEKPSPSALKELNAGLPAQPRHYAAVFTGDDAPSAPGVTPRAYDWQDAVDSARILARSLGVDLVVEQGRHQAFHPGRTAQLNDASGQVVGYAGELHPQVLKDGELPERTVAMEVDFSHLARSLGAPVQARPLSVYPPTDQDVALVVDAQLPAADLVGTLREGAGELLEQVRVFDDYRGSGIEQGRKSLACSLRFRAPDRTLTHEEASRQRERAIELAASRHGAVLRG